MSDVSICLIEMPDGEIFPWLGYPPRRGEVVTVRDNQLSENGHCELLVVNRLRHEFIRYPNGNCCKTIAVLRRTYRRKPK